MPDWLAKVAQAVSPGAREPAPPPSHAPQAPEPAADLDLEALRPPAEWEVSPPPAAEEKAEPEAPEDDLFAALRSETPPAPAASELPDFLSRLPAEPEGPPAAQAGMLDWLQASAEQEKTPPEPEQPSAPPTIDMPDWLTKGEPLASTAEPSAEPEKPAAETAPDWLTDLGTPPAAEPSEAPSATPDWLSETAPPAVGADVGAPDWLKLEPEAESQPPEPVTPEAPASAEMPDWLNTLASESATTPPTEPTPMVPPPEAPAAPAPAEVPDWLSTLASEPAIPPPPEPTPTTPASAGVPAASEMPASAEVPDWLSTLASEPAATPPPEPTPTAPPPEAPAAPAPADVPDWLSTLAEGETAAPAPTPAPGSAASIPAKPSEPPLSEAPGAGIELPGFEPAISEPLKTGDDLLDWMSGPGFDLGVPGVSAPAGGEGEDLLGLTGDLAMPAEEEKAEEAAEPAITGELPEWLRGLKPTAEGETPISFEAQPSELSADALGEISDLRFENILGDAAAETPSPEKVGALKDVSGAIRAELVFDAQTLKGGKVVGDSILTKEQERRILLLEGLLVKQKEEVAITGAARGALPVVRWLVAVVLLLAIALPLLLGFSILSAPPAPSGNVSDAKQVIDNLPQDAKVMVAFEYEPDTAAEMEPLAGALLKHLAGRSGIAVIAISTKPLGPSMADRIFQQVHPASAAAPSAARWVNVGYLPGGSVGINGLVVGDPQRSPFGVDFLGNKTNLSQTTLSTLAPSLIIVLSASAEDLRAWVEQAGRPTSIPLLAATSVSSAPVVAPYRQSGQLVALISGVNDAVSFRALDKQAPDKPLAAIWNAQAIGSLVAVASIVAGGIIYGLMAFREQQERNS